MKRILVTPRSLSAGTHSGLTRLEDLGFTLVRPTPGAMPSEADLVAAIPDCCGWIAGVEPVSSHVISAATSLQVISRNGSGVDNLPMDALNERGISVKRALAANANGVAELALAMMLSGFRHIPLNSDGILAGDWPRHMGREISGSTIGVVGLGAIGRLVVEKFLALGANVIGFDPFATPKEFSGSTAFSQSDTLDSLVAQCDGITLHVPSADAPLLDRKTFDLAKSGSVIVNTARAGLIDPAAMLNALQTGKISTYCTDVFDTEPPELTPLLKHERCIRTSHIGGLTHDSVDRITRATVDNLLDGLQVSCA